jgi:carnosine N-methyltransferase
VEKNKQTEMTSNAIVDDVVLQKAMHDFDVHQQICELDHSDGLHIRLEHRHDGEDEHSHNHKHEHEHEHSCAQPSQSSDNDELQERRHFESVVRSFQGYAAYTMNWIDRKESDWMRLDSELRLLVPTMATKFHYMRQAVLVNSKLLRAFVADYIPVFEHNRDSDSNEDSDSDSNGDNKQSPSSSPSPPSLPSLSTSPVQVQFDNDLNGAAGSFSIASLRGSDMSKVKSTLRQLARDWSAEGAAERRQCYGPLLAEVTRCYGDVPLERRGSIKMLCPGCGLARLPWELARMGFASQGNEFAFYMLFASNFVLNALDSIDAVRIYPFAHSTSNNWRAQDQLRAVTIPDVVPCDLPDACDFSMCAGDFVEVYSATPNQWDCIVTSFFIDTAHNIIEYVRTIATALKDGGRWINLGPLLYHFADTPSEHSIELSLDELLPVIRHFGFTVERKSLERSTYAQNQRSMLQTNYQCVFFSAILSTSATS